ncbi:nSTAND1 domain-containing NTPase [Nostoc sp. 'Peltigera membranacea cyanobiont' N6]|uniref:nSTAND1 domain-containing NTPase n=1 Tax=Nostoc sp. 'Peltigera membranacea cyanobiont' N6 TaxID=1261031 RepID=UPI000CF30628|nr:CHAT domain-containing protein [Nostoc sp. 'Peltigera membranacea cyanobiont' N6]AVH63495.1 WD40 repeat-containing protein [Nostoc sp. 'Peltigera membranacea cyanobiont' N6]
MKKLVILQFDGEFSKGYKVTLEVGEEGKRPDLRIRGELPQALEIIQCFQNWRDIYRSLDGQTRIKKLGARNVNIDDLKQKCDERSQNLLNSFNSWLQSQSFNPIKNCLYQQDWDREDEIRVILSTDCQELRKLPWHLWNGFYAIPHFRITPFEVALSAPDGERRERPFREKIRILIILGDSTEINVKADEQLLQKYCGDAEIVTLVEPLRQELNNYLQDEIGWDMLFFSGHSQTQGTQGRIFLNHDDSLTMAELRDTLLPAIAKRLQLAIFNSCDGLGIARELESLQIPQVIVMREPVPDKVAQEFLKHFLKSFTGGSSLCISVGYARQQLQRLESQFPCASWLPVIVQNQLEVPPTWQSLGITRSPYRGLMAFREEDAENFFGREAFVEQLVIDITSKPLVAVIGASGSGKSSVVFAGLIPQLRQNNIVGDNGGSDCDRSMGRSLREHRQWQIISFRPGKNPFESLAIALEEFRGIAAELLTSSDAQISRRRQELELEIDLKRDISGLQKIIADILHTLSPTHLLLVIDQFEEVYTLCPNAQERQIFIDSLLNAVNHTPWFTLLITLRADFLGKAMSYQPLGKALQDYPPSLLVPMSREELERAIIQPATRFSVELEEGLVNKLIDDVGAGEGSLPLQQFALTQLWGKQRPGLLTHQAYTEIGGVTQALKNHADVVYAGLSETQQKRAQRLFIQLVQPGEGTEDTRRLATRDEVGDYWDLVTLLANERLLVTNRNQLVEDTVEVVHEALIRNWGRLRGWMDDNREFRVWQERLKVALQQWVDSNKDDGGLLRGATLAVAEDWLKKRGEEVSKPQRWFIEKSVALRERERKQKQRLRQQVIGGLAAGLVLALSLAGFAGLQWQEARIREINAQFNADSLSMEALLASNLELDALVKAVKTGKKLQQYSPDVQTDTRMKTIATLQQVIYGVKEVNRLSNDRDTVTKYLSMRDLTYLRFTSDDNSIISVYLNDTVKVWTKKGKLKRTFKANNSSTMNDCFNPKKNNILSVDEEVGTIIFLDLDGKDTNKIKTNYRDSDELNLALGHISTDANGNIITAGFRDNVIKLWSRQGYLLEEFKNSGVKLTSLCLSPDANTIIYGDEEGFIRLWNKNTRKLKTIKAHDGSVHSLKFSPNSKIFASASNDEIKLWDRNGQELQKINGHAIIWSMDFNSDGTILASGGSSGVIKLWDKNGQELQSFNAHSSAIRQVRFNTDGDIIASGGDDGLVKLWSKDARKRDGFQGHNSSYLHTSLSYYGDTIALGGEDGIIKIWTKYGRQIGNFKVDKGLSSLSIASAGNTIISMSRNRKDIGDENNWKIKLWNKQGKLLKTFGKGFEVSLSPDGKIVASADGSEGTITLWSREGKHLRTFKAHNGSSSSIAFSPDSNIIASTSIDDNTVKLWNKQGQLLATFNGHYSTITSIRFSSDSTMIASGDSSGIIKIWNTQGQVLQILKGHISSILSISFSPDSNIIASSAGNIIKLWSFDGRELKDIKTNTNNRILQLSFSDDANNIVSVNDNGRIVIWNFDLNNLLKKGCKHLHDYLKNNSDISPEDKRLCDDILI